MKGLSSIGLPGAVVLAATLLAAGARAGEKIEFSPPTDGDFSIKPLTGRSLDHRRFNFERSAPSDLGAMSPMMPLPSPVQVNRSSELEDFLEQNDLNANGLSEDLLSGDRRSEEQVLFGDLLERTERNRDRLNSAPRPPEFDSRSQDTTFASESRAEDSRGRPDDERFAASAENRAIDGAKTEPANFFDPAASRREPTGYFETVGGFFDTRRDPTRAEQRDDDRRSQQSEAFRRMIGVPSVSDPAVGGTSLIRNGIDPLRQGPNPISGQAVAPSVVGSDAQAGTDLYGNRRPEAGVRPQGLPDTIGGQSGQNSRVRPNEPEPSRTPWRDRPRDQFKLPIRAF